MKATCGHEDMLGYLTNNPCADCTRKAHRAVVNGKDYDPTKRNEGGNQ